MNIKITKHIKTIIFTCVAVVLVIAGIAFSYADEPVKTVSVDGVAKAYKILDCEVVDDGYSYTLNDEYEAAIKNVFPTLDEKQTVAAFYFMGEDSRAEFAKEFLAQNVKPSAETKTGSLTLPAGFYLIDDDGVYSYVTAAK